MSIHKIILCILTLLITTQSTMLLTQPATTGFPNNQIQYWFANFGVVHYNKPTSYSLVVVNSSLCGGPEDANIVPFTVPTFIVPRVVIGCSYTKMAQEAQAKGAQGIVIGYRNLEFVDGNVVLADDGNGRKVRIAVLFIKTDDIVKLSDLSNPKMKVDFQLPQREKSNIDLFLSASGKQNYIFLRNFRQYFNKLSQTINLNVAYHTIECKSCDDSECILMKTCCTFDLENYSSGKGQFVVAEQFRQFRIFKYFASLGTIDQWFQYMDRFDKVCTENWLVSQDCSNKIQAELNIKNLPFINDFETMMQWRNLQVKTGIISLPDISVNGMRHVEQLNAENAFGMICESLTKAPSSCNNPQASQSGKGGIIAAIVISSIVFIITGILCYRKIIKREITNDMSSKVDELVAKYAAKVSEQKKKRKDKLIERMTEEL